MSKYTPEQLRDSAHYTEALLVQRGLMHVTVETVGHIDQLLAHADALETIAKLERELAEAMEHLDAAQLAAKIEAEDSDKWRAAAKKAEAECERLREDAEALRNPADSAINASFAGIVEDQSVTGQRARRAEFKRRYLLVIAAIDAERGKP